MVVPGCLPLSDASSTRAERPCLLSSRLRYARECLPFSRLPSEAPVLTRPRLTSDTQCLRLREAFPYPQIGDWTWRGGLQTALLQMKGYERRQIYSDSESKTPMGVIGMPWKASILDTPVFRSVEPEKPYISKTMFLEYADFDFHLRRLGIFAGVPAGVHPYDLRRGAASAIDNPEGIVAQRMQIMGHARKDEFKHYIHRTVQVDTQAASLGNPSRRELVAGVSRMGASRDANAPTRLTAEQCTEIDRGPRLIALQLERSDYVEVSARPARDCETSE